MTTLYFAIDVTTDEIDHVIADYLQHEIENCCHVLDARGYPSPDSLKTSEEESLMTTIQQMLDLSTAHMSQTAFAELDRRESVAIYHNEYGVIVPVLPDDMIQESWPEELSPPALDQLLVVINYARDLGCDYVKFDRDADVIEDLPSYDW